MAEIKQLQLDGVDILPVTHESAVVDNNGTTIANKYQPKTDNSLTTSAKTVTGAINEIKGNLLEVGDQTTTVSSIKVRYMKYNGENFYPMTHTDAVFDSYGSKLSTTLNTLMTSVNTTLPNRLTTVESNITTLQTNVSNLSTTANTLSTSVGALASLTTSTKTSIVAAINEVFQLGNSARSRLAAALIAKGCTELTASSSLENILTVIESNSVHSNKEGWTVEDVPSASFSFAKYQSGTITYWESTNAGFDDSYSLCKLIINNPNNKVVWIYVQQSSEYNYDYGVISNLNSPLDYSIDDSNYHRSWKGISETAWNAYRLGQVDGWYHVKYRKDSSDNQDDDCFRFYILME